ncbi:hypothetical protein ILFOPFJJ_06626 [Ensifer psoraleae]|nr:hypothetical protein [Sinorhizobium psoraleae]
MSSVTTRRLAAPGQFVGIGSQYREIPVLTDRACFGFQAGNIGAYTKQHPPVFLDCLGHPEPAPVGKIDFKAPKPTFPRRDWVEISHSSKLAAWMTAHCA